MRTAFPLSCAPGTREYCWLNDVLRCQWALRRVADDTIVARLSYETFTREQVSRIERRLRAPTGSG